MALKRSAIFDGDLISYALTGLTNVFQYGTFHNWMAFYWMRAGRYDDPIIFDLYYDSDNYVRAWVDGDGTTIYVRYRVGGVNYTVSFTPDAWVFNEWHHFAASWNAVSGRLRAFWDADEVGTAVALGSAIGQSSATLYLSDQDGVAPLMGRRDRVELINETYEEAKVEVLYNRRF